MWFARWRFAGTIVCCAIIITSHLVFTPGATAEEIEPTIHYGSQFDETWVPDCTKESCYKVTIKSASIPGEPRIRYMGPYKQHIIINSLSLCFTREITEYEATPLEIYYRCFIALLSERVYPYCDMTIPAPKEEFDRAVAYAQQRGSQPGWPNTVQNLSFNRELAKRIDQIVGECVTKGVNVEYGLIWFDPY